MCVCMRCFVGSFQLARFETETLGWGQRRFKWVINHTEANEQLMVLNWDSNHPMKSIQNTVWGESGEQMISEQRLPVWPDILNCVRCYIKTPMCKHTTRTTLLPACTHYSCDGVQERFMSFNPTSSSSSCGLVWHCLSPRATAVHLLAHFLVVAYFESPQCIWSVPFI